MVLDWTLHFSEFSVTKGMHGGPALLFWLGLSFGGCFSQERLLFEFASLHVSVYSPGHQVFIWIKLGPEVMQQPCLLGVLKV